SLESGFAVNYLFWTAHPDHADPATASDPVAETAYTLIERPLLLGDPFESLPKLASAEAAGNNDKPHGKQAPSKAQKNRQAAAEAGGNSFERFGLYRPVDRMVEADNV